MSMDWLNLPIVELAFALGGIIGIVIGFWAGYGVENIVSYQRGYKSGYQKGQVDLCEKCAQLVNHKVKQQFVTEVVQ